MGFGTATTMMYYGGAAISNNNIASGASCQMINATHCICNVTKLTQSPLREQIPDSVAVILALIVGFSLCIGVVAIREEWI
jgi:hypothetical protein